MISRTAVVTSCLLALLAARARAEIPNLSLHLGLSGGGHLTVDKWDIDEVDAQGLVVRPGHTGVVKGRLGLTPVRWLSLEIGGGLVPAPATDLNLILQYEADLLIQPFDLDRLTPFLDLGGGAYHNLSADQLGQDLDPQLHWGLGLRYLLLDWLALRAEVRHLISDGLPTGLLPVSSNVELTLGLDVFPWVASSAEPAPLDADGDGVADDVDRCPDQAGPRDAQGCPPADADGDGVVDAQDRCPDRAGPRDRAGCPFEDADRDGVEDGVDRCPDQPGPPDNDGCEWGDSDGDGLLDDVDMCRELPGPAENIGCPWGDGDGDGVTDNKDRCPGEVGPLENGGCPDTDRDGDGIVDRSDNCPDEAGTAKNQGCKARQLVVLTREKIEILDKVYFAVNKAVIEKRSFALLDNVAAVITSHPELARIRVEGHTDATGNADYNRTLSQQRADAVRDYLIARGVEGARLVAIGHGPDRPVADNKTRQGRAQNRRVEFNIER